MEELKKEIILVHYLPVSNMGSSTAKIKDGFEWYYNRTEFILNESNNYKFFNLIVPFKFNDQLSNELPKIEMINIENGCEISESVKEKLNEIMELQKEFLTTMGIKKEFLTP